MALNNRLLQNVFEFLGRDFKDNRLLPKIIDYSSMFWDF